MHDGIVKGLTLLYLMKKGVAKSKGTAKGTAKGKSGKKPSAVTVTHRCGSCNAPDAEMRCSGCGVEHYCNQQCQKVGSQPTSSPVVKPRSQARP